MLDLSILEKKLDETLAKETKESLTNWLLNNRLSNLKKNLGDGLFKNTIPTCTESFYMPFENTLEENYDLLSNNQESDSLDFSVAYDLAA